MNFEAHLPARLRRFFGLIASRASRLPNAVDDLLHGLPDLADGLIGLAFLSELVIAGQCAGRLLDATSHFVGVAKSGQRSG
jgi:hypothetical protein